MDYIRNPFYELYVSETIPPRDFVRLFSPFLVQHALPLFQPGNVILKGVQGSGKSMLLSLFDPAIRIAYMDAEETFPVPPESRRFISGGINLRHSGAISFGQRPVHPDTRENAKLAPLYFGDFFNYWIVSDLLVTIDRYCEPSRVAVATELGLATDSESLDHFARRLASEECWFGALEGVRTMADLRNRLEERTRTYFKFLNINITEIPSSLAETKTTVGVPVSRTAVLLRETGIIPPGVNVFVRVDQYEELAVIRQEDGNGSLDLRPVVNRALSWREASVSYRVGVRRYAWREDLSMHGTHANLEREREYAELDLDTMLRRRENRKTWVFPRFAGDVLRRRLAFADYPVSSPNQPLIREIFGTAVPAENRAAMYVDGPRGCTPPSIVRIASGVPERWISFLHDLAGKDPLEAKLAYAWAQQRRGAGLRNPPPVPGENGYPWNREWWKKERKEQALMQLAASCQQRLVWAGESDILELSGGNILVFVSLCRHIWAAWLRARREEGPVTGDVASVLPRIDPGTQTTGVEEASRYWYEKTTELPEGHTRQRFINVVARMFRSRLLSDRAMRYPGHNGFSVTVNDLEKDAELRRFLEDAVDYGDLFDAPHTTKEKDRRQRTKYYLKPVLSAHYQIPVKHTKEPIYVDAAQVWQWRREAEGLEHPRTDPVRANPQYSMFEGA
jgi:hypothetical protein